MPKSPTGFTGPLGTPRVLVVDDEEVLRTLLQTVLEEEFQLAMFDTGESVLEFLEHQTADVVLLDKNLPGMSGLQVLQWVKERLPETEVLLITGYASLESAVEALRLGAYDYILKPFDDIEIVLGKVRRAAEKRELAEERRKLLAQVLASNEELRRAHERLRTGYLETLTGMITALEARDAYTRGHSDRVADYSVAIAREMGWSGEPLAILRDGAQLHDLGKIGVREDILNKSGRLSADEFEHIKAHPRIGAEIAGKMEACRHLLPCIRHHHERWDGRGYPDGLAGASIPPPARVIAVADAFDAMTSQRPYRTPLSQEAAEQEVRTAAGSQLEPAAVGAFLIALRRGTIRLTGA